MLGLMLTGVHSMPVELESKSIPVTIKYPSVTTKTSLPYNVRPCHEDTMDNIEDTKVLGSIHTHKG